MHDVRVTHVGGPTVLIEVAGWRILTDPTFDEPGRRYKFGWGTASTKVAGPALDVAELGELDAVLVTHDHHADNLDDAGRSLLPTARHVVTTVSGARRLRVGGPDRPAVSAVGVEDWQRITLEAPDRPPITITATPCRHGPPFSHPVVGDVIGFVLEWDGQTDGVLWISGDTVLFDGVTQVGERFDVDVAVMHLGCVRFPVTGPVHYTLTAEEAVDLTARIDPRVVLPVHYEGWSHFSQGRAAVEAALATAPAGVGRRFHWLPLGESVDVGDFA